jgi:hypothetical protein
MKSPLDDDLRRAASRKRIIEGDRARQNFRVDVN